MWSGDCAEVLLFDRLEHPRSNGERSQPCHARTGRRSGRAQGERSGLRRSPVTLEGRRSNRAMSARRTVRGPPREARHPWAERKPEELMARLSCGGPSLSSTGRPWGAPSRQPSNSEYQTESRTFSPERQSDLVLRPADRKRYGRPVEFQVRR